jgi:hypothetical protein
MPKTPKLVDPPMLGINSAPLPMPPEMFTIIGEIVVLWSRVETSIEADTSIMMQYPNIRRLATTAPHGFAKKLELWRRCVRTLYPTVTLYQNHASAFAAAAKKVAKVRNHLIHGSWDLNPKEDGSFRVQSMRALYRIERLQELSFSVEFVTALLDDIRTLDSLITGFIATKMWHAHLGLLQTHREPSPNEQAAQARRSPAKQKQRTASSRK